MNVLKCDRCHDEIQTKDDEESGWMIEIMPPHTKGSIFGVAVESFEVCEPCVNEIGLFCNLKPLRHEDLENRYKKIDDNPELNEQMKLV